MGRAAATTAAPFDWRVGVVVDKVAEDWFGGADLIRIRAELDDETWIYTYPPAEAAGMLNILARHVQLGKLHPVAGYVLCEMVAEGDGAADTA